MLLEDIHMKILRLMTGFVQKSQQIFTFLGQYFLIPVTSASLDDGQFVFLV